MATAPLSVLAVVVAPAMPAVAVAGYIAALSWPSIHVVVLLWPVLYTLLFGYFLFAVVGLPAIILLQRLNRYSLFWLVATGAVLGAASLSLLIAGFLGAVAELPDTEQMLTVSGVGSLLGAIVGCTFWLVQAWANYVVKRTCGEKLSVNRSLSAAGRLPRR